MWRRLLSAFLAVSMLGWIAVAAFWIGRWTTASPRFESQATTEGAPLVAAWAEFERAQREIGFWTEVVPEYDSMHELGARIRSVLRRTGQATARGRVTLGELWADPDQRVVGRGDEELSLKKREFDLLLFLMRHPDRVWTRDQLLDLGDEGRPRVLHHAGQRRDGLRLVDRLANEERRDQVVGGETGLGDEA